MGRGRKKKYVKTLTSKDKEMLRAFRNCGRLSASHLKENLAMSNRRIVYFQRDGYIEEGRLLNLKTREMEAVYQLTEKGRSAVESYLNLAHCYRSNSGRHDLGVADKYLSLTKDERNTWQTEGELRERHYAKFKGSQASSATDGAYVARDGRFIAFEVVTKNYGQAEIEAKENFAVALGMQLEMTRI